MSRLASFRLLRTSAWTLPVQPSVFKKVKFKNQAISHKNTVQISIFPFKKTLQVGPGSGQKQGGG